MIRNKKIERGIKQYDTQTSYFICDPTHMLHCFFLYAYNMNSGDL